MWRSRLWLLYWVSTAMRRKPALTRFESAKSTSRKLPPKGTAGLARSAVSGINRLPSPPASTMANPREGDMRQHYWWKSTGRDRHGVHGQGQGERQVGRRAGGDEGAGGARGAAGEAGARAES